MKITAQEKKILAPFLEMPVVKKTITNPYSKVVVELEEKAAALYKTIIFYGAILAANPSDDAREIFDTARDVFLKNWPEEYVLLLD
jgi:hypothetical protein